MLWAIAIFLAIIDIVTVVAIFRTCLPMIHKLMWSIAVIGLPIVGAVFFFVVSDTPPRPASGG